MSSFDPGGVGLGAAPSGVPEAGMPPTPASPEGGLAAQVATAGMWSITGRAVLLLANLVATPFTIRLLGSARYGLWALVLSVITWGSLAEAGMWAATTKQGAQRYAAGDDAGEARVVWSGLLIVLVATSSVGLALGLGAGPLMVALHVHGPARDAGTWALRIACATLVVSSLIGTANTAQQVRLQWGQLTRASVTSNLLGAVATPLAVYFVSRSVVSAAAVGLVASTLYLASVFRGAARLQPSLLRPRVDRHTVRNLLVYGGPLTLANLALVPLSTADRFFLAANSSPTAVGYYAVALTVATTLEVLPEELGAPLLPALARLRAQGRDGEHRSLYGKSLTGMFLLLTPATLLVALMAKPFLGLWAGPSYGVHSTVLLLIALVGIWASALAWVPASHLLAESRTKALARLQMAELLPYLVATWVLTAKWGAVGAAIAFSARLVIDAIGRFAIVRRCSSLPGVPLSARRARAMLAPVIFGLACAGTASLTDNLVVRSAVGAFMVVCYGAGVWWLVLSPREQRGLSRLLHDVLPRRSAMPARTPAT